MSITTSQVTISGATSALSFIVASGMVSSWNFIEDKSEPEIYLEPIDSKVFEEIERQRKMRDYE